MANDPNITALAAYAGDYEPGLMTQFLNQLAVGIPGVTLRTDIKSKTNLTKIKVADGAKPYTGVFNAKSDVSYHPGTIEVEKCQRDLSVEPDKYRGTWMEKLRGRGENAANMTIPYAEVFYDSVLRSLAAELNNNTLYHGKGKAAFTTLDTGSAYVIGDLVSFTQDSEVRYFKCVANASAGQTPTTHPAKWQWAGALAITKGFGTRIAEAITATTLDVITTGSVTASNAYAKFLLMHRGMDSVLRNSPHVILCSQTDYDHLLDNYEDLVKKYFSEQDKMLYLPKSNGMCAIQPWTALAGSRRLICTTLEEANLVAGTDDANDWNRIKPIEKMYTLDLGITWMFGTAIRDTEAMVVSDQA